MRNTLALILGLLAVHLLRPGSGFNADPATLDSKATADYVTQALSQGVAPFLLHLIPKSFADARALTNIIGIGVATITVARWEGELDYDRLNGELAAGRARKGGLVRFE